MELRDRLISRYFSFGLQNNEILAFLNYIHGMDISIRTLKRALQRLQLYRRKNFSRIEDIVEFIQMQLETSNQLHGYRWIHLKCVQHGLVVTQNIVRELLLMLDPVRVELRKRKRLLRKQYYNKGPNYLWHLDSYDKLKPYGLCINGCIDGYSRHIIWLHVSRTSNDPKVIAGYFVNSIQDSGGCPVTIRSDMGTENVCVEKIQNSLRDVIINDVNRPPYLYGRSTANQRIKAWWSILRKKKSQYWINLLETLRDDGLFDGSFLDKSLVQFCFLDIIQHELDEVVYEWNTHKIQNSRNSNSPTGRPVVMYEMPNLYGTRNYLLGVPEPIIPILKEECTFIEYVCEEDIYNICNDIIVEKNLDKNNDPYQAYQLYIELRQEIKLLL